MSKVVLNNNLKLHLDNLELPYNVLSKISTRLRQLYDICPSETAMLVKFSRAGKNAVAEVSVRGKDLLFYGKGMQDHIVSALESAMTQVRSKLKDWRHTRFIPDLPKLNVMVVDDDPFSVALMKQCLTKGGCNTMTIQNPEDAVGTISPEQTDLMILDWSMPEMDGAAMLVAADQEIKKSYDPDWIPRKKIPVLIYSGVDQQGIRFPETKHFREVGRIPKSTPYEDLKTCTNGLLKKLKHTSEQTAN